MKDTSFRVFNNQDQGGSRRLVLSRTTTAYVVASGISIVGTALGLLGATGSTAAAGRQEYGATYTGIFVSLVLLFAALAVPIAPRLSFHIGTRKAFALSKASWATAWFVAGGLLIAGASPMPVLLIAAPFFGALGGLSTPLSPIVSRSYLTSTATSGAVARMNLVGGLSWAIGAIGGGALLGVVPLGWGLVLNGVFTIPLVLVTLRVAPAIEPATPETAGSKRSMTVCKRCVAVAVCPPPWPSRPGLGSIEPRNPRQPPVRVDIRAIR